MLNIKPELPNGAKITGEMKLKANTLPNPWHKRYNIKPAYHCVLNHSNFRACWIRSTRSLCSLFSLNLNDITANFHIDNVPKVSKLGIDSECVVINRWDCSERLFNILSSFSAEACRFTAKDVRHADTKAIELPIMVLMAADGIQVGNIFRHARCEDPKR